MKRLVTLIASLLVLGCTAALAQEYVPTPVTVSKEKVKLNGKVYLSHVVLERQTLYGISKAYGVTEEELYEANPSLRETGLQKNSILLIPFKEGVKEAPEAPQPKEGSYTDRTLVRGPGGYCPPLRRIGQGYHGTERPQEQEA